jgi:hypothetical protein
MEQYKILNPITQKLIHPAGNTARQLLQQYNAKQIWLPVDFLCKVQAHQKMRDFYGKSSPKQSPSPSSPSSSKGPIADELLANIHNLPSDVRREIQTAYFNLKPSNTNEYAKRLVLSKQSIQQMQETAFSQKKIRELHKHLLKVPLFQDKSVQEINKAGGSKVLPLLRKLDDAWLSKNSDVMKLKNIDVDKPMSETQKKFVFKYVVQKDIKTWYAVHKLRKWLDANSKKHVGRDLIMSALNNDDKHPVHGQHIPQMTSLFDLYNLYRKTTTREIAGTFALPALTRYHEFFRAMFPQLRDQNPNLSAAEVMRLVRLRWDEQLAA